MLNGNLDLTFAADQRERTFIESQYFRAPFHISKPYWDGQTLLVQVVNPTAGVFSGDRLTSRIVVKQNARVLLTTPSANRIHAMPLGRASVEQSFVVESDGCLEVFPELFIPQAGSRYRQRTVIEVADQGQLYFVETLAPGRVARGEIFQFEEIDWHFDLFHRGTLIARERFQINRTNGSLAGLQTPFAAGYYASCYLVSALLPGEHPVWNRISQLSSSEMIVGVSQLLSGASTIKVIAKDSVTLRRFLREVRILLGEFFAPLRSSPRKI